MFLLDEQLIALTGKRTRPAQARRLKALRIPFLWDGKDGPVSVLRTAVEQRGSVGHQYAEEPDFTVFRQAA